ncbi:MAG: MgtC/SapB family protein [Candidatus Jorgensenbacteria bacterium]
MLSLEDMLIRLGIAVALGAVVGFGRELVGKEAGVRTDITVAGGAALFALAGISLPYLIAPSPEQAVNIIANNAGFLALIGNVVLGIGFLGAGIIVREGLHVRGVTTAATVWFVAAVGVLSGIGLLALAAIAAVAITALLFLLRTFDVPVGERNNH